MAKKNQNQDLKEQHMMNNLDHPRVVKNPNAEQVEDQPVNDVATQSDFEPNADLKSDAEQTEAKIENELNRQEDEAKNNDDLTSAEDNSRNSTSSLK
jgi:hypothetical protein